LPWRQDNTVGKADGDVRDDSKQEFDVGRAFLAVGGLLVTRLAKAPARNSHAGGVCEGVDRFSGGFRVCAPESICSNAISVNKARAPRLSSRLDH